MSLVVRNLFTASTNKIRLQSACSSIAFRRLTTVLTKAKRMYSHEDTSDDIVWMDLEMTGLDAMKDKILEVSCIITDKNLIVKNEGPSFAIKQPEEVLQQMSDWCLKQHTESGLVQKCLQSQITNEEGEKLILDFLKQHIPKKTCPLAGNTIYMDRLFLCHHMPSVNEYLHYRIIDVSTIKELVRRWNTNVFNNIPMKKLAHRSLDDIYESIEELKYYKQFFFNDNIVS